MNLLPEQPASEKPELRPTSSPEPEVTEAQPTSSPEPEVTEAQPTSSPEPEVTEAQPTSSPEPEVTEAQPIVPSETTPVEEIEAQHPVSSEPEVATEGQTVVSSEATEVPASSETTEVEATDLDEDEDEDDEIEELDEPRSGVYIQKGILIAAACAVVIVALLATFLVFFNHPKDPPTDWIASYTPPAGTSTTTGKILYYLHWTNKNGELTGQLHLATVSNGKPESLIAPATGLYSKDNRIIYVVVTISGQASTLTGNINSNNDTLILNPAGAPTQSNLFVFHTGSADDYKQATNKLGATTK